MKSVWSSSVSTLYNSQAQLLAAQFIANMDRGTLVAAVSEMVSLTLSVTKTSTAIDNDINIITDVNAISLSILILIY